MGTERVQRRLAAILATDVVGFSRLMGEDEAGTLARLKALRAEIVDPAVARHGGRTVKLMGDGALVEFASAVDAVSCALDIQSAMAARGAGEPEASRIRFRAGINLGDIIVDGDDIYGEGVNVAARLEGLAEPGGVCVSRAVRDQVRDKLPAQFEDLGERAVKNIARPVRAFNVTMAPAAQKSDAAQADRTAPPTVSNRPSIVVLAFANMSGDPEQEYFSDGIAEDIITDLSKISGLFVIARNSAFTYKGHSVNLREVSRELGVRYVLEGSVRKAANRVRVTAQLIDGSTGGHVWAERYDRELSDIFAVQDELTREIVGALKLKLSETEKSRIGHRGTENLDAYDHYLRGREYFFTQTRASTAAAQAELEKAIALDPDFAVPYAYLAMTYLLDYMNRWSASSEDSLRRSHELASKSVALDDGEAQAYFALASSLLWMREHDRSIAAAERAVALDPNFSGSHATLGQALYYAGRPAEALAAYDKAARLDPHSPDIYLHFLAQAHARLGNHAEAIDLAKRRILRNPQTDITRVLLASCYGHLGDAEAARAAWAGALEFNPAYSIAHRRASLPHKDVADFEHMVDGLRKAGIPV